MRTVHAKAAPEGSRIGGTVSTNDELRQRRASTLVLPKEKPQTPPGNGNQPTPPGNQPIPPGNGNQPTPPGNGNQPIPPGTPPGNGNQPPPGTPPGNQPPPLQTPSGGGSQSQTQTSAGGWTQTQTPAGSWGSWQSSFDLDGDDDYEEEDRDSEESESPAESVGSEQSPVGAPNDGSAGDVEVDDTYHPSVFQQVDITNKDFAQGVVDMLTTLVGGLDAW